MSNGLSDFNTTGYVSKRTSQEALFADLNLAMPIHPNKRDVVPLTDIDAVKNAVKNLVLTNFGEKLFMPRFGGNVTSYLFDNADGGFTSIAIRNEITEAINRFEPRVTDLTVQVQDNTDTNAFDVTIGFKIVGTQQQAETEFQLNRIR